MALEGRRSSCGVDRRSRLENAGHCVSTDKPENHAIFIDLVVEVATICSTSDERLDQDGH